MKLAFNLCIKLNIKNISNVVKLQPYFPPANYKNKIKPRREKIKLEISYKERAIKITVIAELLHISKLYENICY